MVKETMAVPPVFLRAVRWPFPVRNVAPYGGKNQSLWAPADIADTLDREINDGLADPRDGRCLMSGSPPIATVKQTSRHVSEVPEAGNAV
jgi:hypothetical protein